MAEKVDMGPENYGTNALATMVEVGVMPESDVSDRTYATYRIGAHLLLKELISGNWDNMEENLKQFIPEFIDRVSANAERNGVSLDRPSDR